jgi:hypothetical protein
MPIYTNNTVESITAPARTGTITIAAEESAEVDFFIDAPKYGLTETNEEPRVDPVTLAAGMLELFNGDSSRVYVPDCKIFLVSIICKSGDSEVRESYEDADISTRIGTLNAFRATLRRSDVEAFWITGTGDDDNGPAIIEYMISRVV